MDDDFNTPQALAALFDFNKEVNTLLNSGRSDQRCYAARLIDDLYRSLGGDVLGTSCPVSSRRPMVRRRRGRS